VPTQQQPLEQRQAFARRPRQDRLLTVGAILLQALLIVKELFPTDVSLVVVLQADAPVGHRHRVLPVMNLTFRADLPPVLITAEDVPAGIGGVLEQAQHPAVGQAAPDQLPVPCSPIGPLGETERAGGEALHHREGAARFTKQPKHQAHRAPHFFVRIQDDTAFLVVVKADRKGET